MTDSVRDWVGQQLGNYRLLHMLQQKSTTDVYLGEHIFLKTQAAITVLPEQPSREALEELLTETRSLALMKHPNLLRILELGVKGKMPFLVTDYTPNGSLRQHHPKGTQVPPTVIASYVKQIAAALDYIHNQGMVHGRVRPENILQGTQKRILLSLTIVAQDEASIGNSVLTKTEMLEELEYKAPEQFQGQLLPASDQYALGVLVYEWLSGETPFHGTASEIQKQQQSQSAPSLRTKIPTISPELEQVVMTALAKDPLQRFANINAFAHALKQLLPPTPSPNDTLYHNEQQMIKLVSADLTSADLPTLAKIPPRRKAAKGIPIALILVALLTIGATLIYNAHLFPPTKHATTVLPSPRMVTQTVVARGTQQAEATFTAQDVNTIYKNATQGTPLINDPLNNPSTSIWKSTTHCFFSQQTYHIQIPGQSYTVCLTPKSTPHNFAYQVQMSIVKGSAGGIVFRSDSRISNFYAFIFYGAPYNFSCSFTLYKNDKSTDLRLCSLPQNLQTFNIMTIIAYAHTFYFYINKVPLMKVQDSTLETGMMGLYALSDSKNTTADVIFRNAKVWQL